MIWLHALHPIRFGQNTLDHQGVDVDQADLQQVERQHGELLVPQVVGSDLTTFAVGLHLNRRPGSEVVYELNTVRQFNFVTLPDEGEPFLFVQD